MKKKDTAISVRLSTELHGKLEGLAIAEGRMVSLSEMVRLLIERAKDFKLNLGSDDRGVQ